MRGILAVYLVGVIVLLGLSTSIESDEEVGLDHILIAAFGWPLFASLMAVRALTSR